MAYSAGVWIDHYRAVVVLLMDDGVRVLKLDSDHNTTVASPGGARENNSLSRKDYTAGNMRERKADGFLQKFFDRVIEHVLFAESVAIVGPGEAKGEFRKRLAKQSQVRIESCETADKMTDGELTEYFRQELLGQRNPA
jgi:hypothetical protein